MSMNDDGLTSGPEAFQNFSTLLTGIEDGRLNADISMDLENLVRDLNERIAMGVKGAGTVSITIKLLANQGVIEVTGDYKIKAPKMPRGRSIFHIAGGKFLSRKDPRQGDLPLRAVEQHAAPMRTLTQ